MKILIEEYRGWEISFDTEKEEFYTLSNEHDTDKTKKSFSATKKYIDDYIKDNVKFVPVDVETEGSIWGIAKKIKLIGIRKDGAFMYQDGSDKTYQLSKYSEGDYYLSDPINDSIYAELNLLIKEREEIDKKIKEASKRIVKVGIDTIREKYQTTK